VASGNHPQAPKEEETVTHQPENLSPAPKRPDRTLRIAIAIALVIIVVVTSAVTAYVWNENQTKRQQAPANWQNGGVSAYATQFGELEDLRAEIRQLDDEINALNAKADQYPQDDAPLNDMNRVMEDCLAKQDAYRAVAAAIPAAAMAEAGFSANIGGADQQADCTIDNAGDRLSPPPSPSATGE
jgi:cytochrome c556